MGLKDKIKKDYKEFSDGCAENQRQANKTVADVFRTIVNGTWWENAVMAVTAIATWYILHHWF